MNSKIAIQFSAFLLYVANISLYTGWDKHTIHPNLNLVFGIAMAALFLAFFADYWFNYRKKQQFIIPASAFFMYSIIRWAFDGEWLLAGANLLIAAIFILFNKLKSTAN